MSLVAPGRGRGGGPGAGRGGREAPSVLVAGHQDVAGSDVVADHQAVIYRELRRTAEEHLLLIE